MTAATIDRFSVRWRLTGPADAVVADALLDDLCDGRLAEAFDRALDRALDGRGPDELVAVRRVDVPAVRVPGGTPVPAAVTVWADAVARAVAEQLHVGGRGVVRYPGIAAAVLDVVVRCAVGNSDRVWAWRQLGLWPGGGAADPDQRPGPRVATAVGVPGDRIDPDRLVAALARAPAQLATVLAEAARLVDLVPIVHLLGGARLDDLVRLAWAALGAPWPGAGALPPADAAPGPDDRAVTPRARAAPLARVAVRLSDPGCRAALAALAAAVEEPAVVAAGQGAAVVAALLAAPTPAAAGWVGARHTAVVPDGGPSPTPAPAVVPTPAGPAGVLPAAMPPAAMLPAAGASGEAGDRARAAAAPEAPDEPPSVPRRRAVTGWGGLLFCLNLLDPRSGRGSGEPDDGGVRGRYELYAVGERLLRHADPHGGPPEPADPALLAFCGLPPGSEPPEPRPTRPTADVLDARADTLVAALHARLDRRPGGAEDQAGRLSSVLRRSAEIVADPGWLEAWFDLGSATVEVRAAGLDLDPGWLPVLGCAVRFRYV